MLASFCSPKVGKTRDGGKSKFQKEFGADCLPWVTAVPGRGLGHCLWREQGRRTAQSSSGCRKMVAVKPWRPSKGIAGWGAPSAHGSGMLGLPSDPCPWTWKKERQQAGGVVYHAVPVKTHSPSNPSSFRGARSQPWGAQALHGQQL